MDKENVLERTRLQQAGKSITDMIKESKIEFIIVEKIGFSDISMTLLSNSYSK